MSTQIILLERVESLGNMGDIVSVKPGFARNYLLPQKKALRASKDNIAYFEAQKKNLEAANATAKKDAEKHIKPLKDLTVSIIRQASEAGQLFGSVAARDIAEAVAAATKVDVTRNMVSMNQNFKFLGLFPVDISLHPEVKVEITINIARNEEEAGIQLTTGRAMTEEAPYEEAAPEALIDEENLSVALEDDALEAEKVKAEDDAVVAAEDAEKAAAKAVIKAEKDAAKAALDAETAETAETEVAEEAPAAEEDAKDE